MSRNNIINNNMKLLFIGIMVTTFHHWMAA